MDTTADLKREMATQALERLMDNKQVPARYLLAALKRIEKILAEASQERKDWSSTLEGLQESVKQHIDDLKVQKGGLAVAASKSEKLFSDIQSQFQKEIERVSKIDHLKGDPGESAKLEDVVAALKPHLPKPESIDKQALIAEVVSYLQPQEGTAEDLKVDDLDKDALFDEFIARIQKERPIDVSHLKNAESFLFGGKKYKIEELMHGAGSSTGGSTTVYTETPSGAIDGANKVYTTTHTITTVIGLWYNGEFVHPSEYVASGAGFTMTTALPVIAGAAFTISYV